MSAPDASGPSWGRVAGEVAVTAVACWAWAQVFILPMCDMWFHCGCTWPWAGGITHCNIYDPALPDCPWCTAPSWAAWIPVRGIIGAMVVTSFGAGRWWPRWWSRPVAAVAAFLFFGFLAGLGFAVATGSDFFLWFQVL